VFKVADLCCGVGISGDGYVGAGMTVTGFDNDPKLAKYYPGEFRCMDITTLTADDLAPYDLVHLGAPCQYWSQMMSCQPPEVRAQYKDLITPMRPVLDELSERGVPYVIENVEPCDVLRPQQTVLLCGLMFGKELYRHRKIETGGGLVIPPLFHPKHVKRASRAGHWEPGTVMSIAGHIAPIAMARELMGVTRKMPREQLVEAAPAFYMGYVAAHAQAYLSQLRAA
jgi:DNA (cytosine-5)-methyltransferase 1